MLFQAIEAAFEAFMKLGVFCKLFDSILETGNVFLHVIDASEYGISDRQCRQWIHDTKLLVFSERFGRCRRFKQLRYWQSCSHKQKRLAMMAC